VWEVSVLAVMKIRVVRPLVQMVVFGKPGEIFFDVDNRLIQRKP